MMIGWRKSKRLGLAALAAAAVLLVLAGICMGIFAALGTRLESQAAAERFQGESETRFAQVSCFFPLGTEIGETEVYTFRQSLTSSFLAASLEPPETGRLYMDTYSASAELTVKGARGTATVTALGVGGDYFYFHPLYLRSGSYIYGDDLMHDRVVLDEELAWKLFGGIELEGLTVAIGGKDYIVAGVVSREDDFATERAYTQGAGLFIAYDTLNALTEAKISCYELVCADPISGFALGLVKTGFPKADSLENSDRFTPGSIFKVVGKAGDRAMGTTGVAYPYWENAARIVETRMGVYLTLAVIFIIYPVFYAVWTAAAGIGLLKKKIRKAVPEYLERRSERRYRKRTADKGA